MSENVGAPMDGVSIRKGWEGDGDLELSLGSCCKQREVVSLTNCSSQRYIQQGSEEDKFGLDEEAGSDCTTEDNSQGIPSYVGKGIGSGINQIRAENNKNNNGAVEEVWKRKRAGTSRYKGVVQQPKGRWGAQIYEKHRRVWLGTFNTEQDAAQSYDTAALKFRGRKAITNFAPLEDTLPEAVFLRRHSKAEIVDMLRKRTYHEELQQSYTNNTAAAKRLTNCSNGGQFALETENATFPKEHLFDKALTPSDVGKLNRLVIPKHHAQRYFPIDKATTEKGIMLNFEDSTGRTWRFRYSYWNSSQSYVLTKGWSRYVKDKYLRAGDIVTFERSTGGCRQLFVSFCRSPCNLFPQKAYSLAGFFPPEFLPGSSRWNQASLPVEHRRPLICNQYIPWSDLAPFDFPSAFDLCSPVNSPSLERKSIVLQCSKPTAKTFTSSTCPDSSSVTVFGVNLSLLSSSTLNLFPLSLADKDGPNYIEAVQQ